MSSIQVTEPTKIPAKHVTAGLYQNSPILLPGRLVKTQAKFNVLTVGTIHVKIKNDKLSPNSELTIASKFDREQLISCQRGTTVGTRLTISHEVQLGSFNQLLTSHDKTVSAERNYTSSNFL
jgi:hypothetical protein